MNDFDLRSFRRGAFTVIQIGYGKRLAFRAVNKTFPQRNGDAMRRRAVDLAIDHVGVDHRAVIANDEIAQDFDFTRCFIDFYDRRVSARRKSKLRAH